MAHDITHGMVWQLNSGMLCWIANWIVFSYFITLSIALPIVLLPLLCIVLTDVLLVHISEQLLITKLNILLIVFVLLSILLA